MIPEGKLLYSVSVLPPAEATAAVKAMKDRFAAKVVKNYGSRNSAAHLTVCELLADKHEHARLRAYLRFIVTQLAGTDLVFDATGSYPGTLFLAPDAASKRWLTELFHRISKERPSVLKAKTECKDPHMTIARKLNPDQLESGLQLFAEDPIRISFFCSGLTLRVHRGGNTRFEVEEEFLFSGSGNTRLEQISLF